MLIEDDRAASVSTQLYLLPLQPEELGFKDKIQVVKTVAQTAQVCC